MASQPPGQGRSGPAFSPDGMWWWDGREWKSALSPDRRWRWNGQAWVPHGPPAAGGAAAAVAITVVAFAGVIALVSAAVVVVLLTMGNQIANVFSNVAAALSSP